MFRMYQDSDFDACRRIWMECGWIEDGEDGKTGLEQFLAGSKGRVAQINGAAECLVTTSPGTIRYLTEDLSFGCVTSVTTSRVARKQGLAARLLAQAVAEDAVSGTLVSGLGMFEQGFYNRLGFGSGSYASLIPFDPARLRVPVPKRPPRRLTRDDWEAMHATRLKRQLRHGSCNLFAPELTQAEVLFHDKNAFGLGFDDDDGNLSHWVWFQVRGCVELGPYEISGISAQTNDQFMELLGAVKMLGDQVNQIAVVEPTHIQLQDLLEQPFKQWRMTRRGKFHAEPQSFSWWQVRMNDLSGCLERTKIPWGEVKFNVELTDSIHDLLPPDCTWRGVVGSWVVTLGPTSNAAAGRDSRLPTLRATINAFSRLWLGVRPASGLAVTDDLDGPESLLRELDTVLRLPPSSPDWDF